MNHILKYRGFRFYQSSYDKDERGTVLSVNHDPAGMLTTYAGYALLFLFIVLSIINRTLLLQDRKKGILEFTVPPSGGNGCSCFLP